MILHNPFKRHRFPREVILLAVRWCCRYPRAGRSKICLPRVTSFLMRQLPCLGEAELGRCRFPRWSEDVIGVIIGRIHIH